MSTRRRGEFAGSLLIVVAASALGGVTVIAKVLLTRGVPVLVVLAFRFGLAAITLAIVALLLGLPLTPSRGEGRYVFLCGFLGYGVETTVFYSALGRGTVPAVTLLVFAYPIFVVTLASVIGGRRPGALIWAALAVGMTGSAVVIATSGRVEISASGAVLALTASVLSALFVIARDRLIHSTHSLIAALYMSAAATAFFGAARAATGLDALPASMPVLWLLAMGLLTAIGFGAFVAAIPLLGAPRASVLSIIEVAVAAVLAVVFLGEPLRVVTVLGGLLILAGGVLAFSPRAADRS